MWCVRVVCSEAGVQLRRPVGRWTRVKDAWQRGKRLQPQKKCIPRILGTELGPFATRQWNTHGQLRDPGIDRAKEGRDLRPMCGRRWRWRKQQCWYQCGGGGGGRAPRQTEVYRIDQRRLQICNCPTSFQKLADV